MALTSRARPASLETTTALLADPPPWWIAALALLGALLVQSTLAPLASFRGGIVSVVVLVTMWFALRTGPSGALAFGTFVGAGEDGLGTTGAAWTLSTAVVAFALSRGRARLPVDRPALLAVTIATTTLARASIALVVLALERRPAASLGSHLHADLWQALLTALAGTLVFALFPRLAGARGRY